MVNVRRYIRRRRPTAYDPAPRPPKRITRRDYNELRAILGPLPKGVKSFTLVGGLYKRGYSEHDIDILVELDYVKDENAYDEFQDWLQRKGMEFTAYTDDGEWWYWPAKRVALDFFFIEQEEE